MKVSHPHTPRFWRFVSAVLATIVIVMPFHAFLSTWYGTLIGPLWLWKSWKEIVLGALSLLILGWILKNHRAKEVFSDKLVLLLCTYAIIVIGLSSITHSGLNAKLAGLAMDLRYLIIFAAAYLLARFAPELRELWLKRAPRLLIIAGVALSALGILQVTVVPLNFLEHFGYNKDRTIAPYTLIDANPDAPRAFATLRGPNDFGAYLILPLVVALAYLVRVRDKVLASVMLVAGLIVSASRSAWIGALAAIAMLVVDTKRVSTRKLIIASSTIAVLMIGTLLASLSIPEVRLAVFHSSPGDSSLTEGSTDKHWSATLEGIKRVIQNPLGCGAGCSGPASFYGQHPKIAENYYVQIAETYGVVGLALWLGIFGIVMVRLWKSDTKLSSALFASGAGLALVGFWLHVWNDDPLSLTWWCLAGIVIGATLVKQPKTK